MPSGINTLQSLVDICSEQHSCDAISGYTALHMSHGTVGSLPLA